MSVHASVHLCSGWVRYFKVEEALGRTPRVEYAGALYHVMCRGNRRETIFEDEQDCCLFLETLAEVCARTGWEVCAYVLMPNHYHLVLHTPEANLVSGMKWFCQDHPKQGLEYCMRYIRPLNRAVPQRQAHKRHNTQTAPPGDPKQPILVFAIVVDGIESRLKHM